MLNSFDNLLAALANKQQVLVINKASISNQASGFPCSLWRATGTPAQGAIPGAAAACTKALTGALPFNNPVNPDLLYAAKASLAVQNTAQGVYIMDRLAHMGGLSGNVATSQTVNLAPAITRAAYTEMLWFLEIYTDIGTTATTATITYTDVNDVPAKTITGVAIGSTTNSQNRASRLIPLFPSDGIAIKSIQSVQLALATGIAGSFGVTVAKQLASLETGLSYSVRDYDWAKLNITNIKDDSCLWLITFCNTTTSGAVLGNLYLAAG